MGNKFYTVEISGRVVVCAENEKNAIDEAKINFDISDMENAKIISIEQEA